MSGFGSGFFGLVRFGISDFGDAALWKSVPRRIREIDLATDEQYLYKLYRAMIEEYNILSDKVLALTDQVNPLKVIGTQRVEIDLDSAEYVYDDYWEDCIVFTCVAGQLLDEIGVQWTLKIEDTVYTVVRLRGRNEPQTPNEIWVQGKSIPTVSAGTMYSFSRPSLLKHLYNNSGFELDEYDTDQYQRGIARHGLKLQSIKSNQQSYVVRCSYAGWDVLVEGLWRISDGYSASLPLDNVFLIDGVYYTNIVPIGARFDDIPGDISFVDPDLGATYLLDNHWMYDDSSGDGMSPAKYFAQNVLVADPPLSTDILSMVVTELTPAQASAYGIPYGYSVRLRMTQEQRNKIGYVSPGIFSLVDIATGEEYYIFQEHSYNPTSNAWTVIVDEPPSHEPPLLHDFGVKYYPGLSMGCSWCKSYKLRVVLTLQPDFDYSIYGSSLSDAIDRVLYKIQQFVPIHARIGRTEIVAGVSVSVPAGSVSGVIL